MKKRGRALALLLAAVLTVSSVPGTVMAADGVKPQDGTTKEQPFWSGTVSRRNSPAETPTPPTTAWSSPPPSADRKSVV